MMKELLYKEFKLTLQPIVIMFYLYSVLFTLIPTMSTYINFYYSCAAIILLFICGTNNHDNLFSAALPVSKKEIVKARFLLIALIQFSSILFSVPFALLSHFHPILSPFVAVAEKEIVRIEPSPAAFALDFLLASFFNFVFLSLCYRKADNKFILEFILSFVVYFVFTSVIEGSMKIFSPFADFFSSMERSMILKQTAILLVSIAFWSISFLVTFPVAVNKFNKVDL